MINMKNQKVWLITGASQTLSILTVKHLLAKKQLVIATTNNNITLDTVLLKNSDLTIISLDITQQQEVEKMVKKIIKQHGRIDVLINNAGFLRELEEAPVEEINNVFLMNAKGTFNILRYVLPHMYKENKAHIINFSCSSSVFGYPGLNIYNASSKAVEGLRDALKIDLDKLGIKSASMESFG